MNRWKIGGLVTLTAGGLTTEQWLLIVSILMSALGLIQEYLKGRRK